MILTYHPCFNPDDYPAHLRDIVKRTPKFLGFWRNASNPSLPNPAEYIDEAWQPDIKAMVLEYLALPPYINAYMGSSLCRLCGVRNRYREQSDGTYTWPEGFAHYVSAHDVRPPEEFVRHVLWVSTATPEWWGSGSV